MRDIILRGLLIIISCFELLNYYDLMYAILLKKISIKKRNIVLIICNVLGIGILLGINREILFFSHVFLGIVVIMTFLCTYIVAKKQAVLIAGCVLIYFMFVALVDFIFAYASLIFLDTDFGNIVHYGGISVEKIGIYCCSRITVLICSILIKKLDFRIVDEFRGWILGIGILFVILVRYYQINFVSMIDGTINLNGQNGAISVLITLIVVTVLGSMFYKFKLIEKENEFLISKEESEIRRYKEQQMIIERNKELVHDIKNHFLIIRAYEKAGDYEKLHNYIEEIMEGYIETNPGIYTGNRTIDFIIDQKRMIAEKEGIKVVLELTMVGQLPFQEHEICALLGNLLDNAIEASKKLLKNEKIIYLTIKKKKQILFLEIINNVEEKIVRQNDAIITTKKDKTLHGYGLKIVQRIVNEYDGIISYEMDKEKFSVSISFFDLK